MVKQSQFRGAIIGQCVGDLVGMPVERHSLAECQRYADELRSGRVGHRERESYAFGQYTDDSQLMRELLISLIACESFDPADYAQRFAKLHQTKRLLGGSSASRKVAMRLSEGMQWDQCGTPAPYARNGSAMRVCPIGLIFNEDPPTLIQSACDQAKITHQDSRSQAGAVAIAGSIALAVQQKEIAPETFLGQLSRWVNPIDPSMAQYLTRLTDWIDLPVEQALAQICPLGNPPASLDDWEGITPWIVPSVLWSLYAFLRSPNDYWSTICTAIAGGGDTDTTAAMSGAISGAFLGIEAVPEEIAQTMTDMGSWGYEPMVCLSDLAFHLTKIKEQGE